MALLQVLSFIHSLLLRIGPYTADVRRGASEETNGSPDPRPSMDDFAESPEYSAGCWNKGARCQGTSVCSYQLSVFPFLSFLGSAMRLLETTSCKKSTLSDFCFQA